MPKHPALVIKFICSSIYFVQYLSRVHTCLSICPPMIEFIYLFVMFVCLCVNCCAQVAPYKTIALRTRHLKVTNHALAVQAPCVPGHPTSQNFQTEKCPDFFVFLWFFICFFFLKKAEGRHLDSLNHNTRWTRVC